MFYSLQFKKKIWISLKNDIEEVMRSSVTMCLWRGVYGAKTWKTLEMKQKPLVFAGWLVTPLSRFIIININYTPVILLVLRGNPGRLCMRGLCQIHFFFNNLFCLDNENKTTIYIFRLPLFYSLLFHYQCILQIKKPLKLY